MENEVIDMTPDQIARKTKRRAFEMTLLFLSLKKSLVLR